MEINSPFNTTPQVEKHDVLLVIQNLSDNSVSNSHYTSDTISQESMVISKKINHQIEQLFENVSSNQKYTTNNKMFNDGFFGNEKPKSEQLKALILSPITNGITNEAHSVKNDENNKVGSDYFNLFLIKKAYDKLGDDVMLSDKSYQLLDRYNIKPEQLNHYDADFILDNIKNNPKPIQQILDQNKALMVDSPNKSEDSLNVTQSTAERYIDTQLKVNSRINQLFENVSSNESFVTDVIKNKDVTKKELETSPISNGTILSVLKNPSFLTEGSDYIDLHIIKNISNEFGDKVKLSTESDNLLKKYDLTLDSLKKVPDHELRNQQENLSVNNISTKTDSFVIHTIATGFSISDNSPLKDGVSRKDRVEILRSFNPEICCSTIQRGVKQTSNDFGLSDVGVIIGSGLITHASSSDDGTQVDRDGNRNIRKIGNLQNEVETVIRNRKEDDSYNEILVKNPKIAGLYISFDKEQKFNEDNVNYTNLSFNSPDKIIDKIKTVQDMANDQENPLPVFAIINGQVRDVNFNMEYLEKYSKKNDPDGLLRSEWKNISDEDFLGKAMTLGHEYGPNDLSNYARRNELSNERKIELVEKNEGLLKNEISMNKLNELYSVKKDKEPENSIQNSKNIDNLFDNSFEFNSGAERNKKNTIINSL